MHLQDQLTGREKVYDKTYTRLEYEAINYYTLVIMQLELYIRCRSSEKMVLIHPYSARNDQLLSLPRHLMSHPHVIQADGVIKYFDSVSE